VSAGDIIAVIALAVSTASAVAAGLSLYLGFRESSRRDEEIRLLRDEAARRDEELTLLREQFAAEQEERRRAQQAKIVVPSGRAIPTNSSERGIEYQVPVGNGGAYIASRVSVELVSNVGAPVGYGTLDRSLVPGDEDTVAVMTPPADRFTGPYSIYVEWDDGRSERNREGTGVTVGAP
jgi:hypothetical protein